MTDRVERLRARLDDAVVDALAASVEPQVEELADELTREYRQVIASYEPFDASVVRTNTRAILQAAVSQIFGPGPRLGTEDLDRLARSLSGDGVMLGPLAYTVQIAARRLFTLLRDRARELDLAYDDIAEMQDIAWEWAADAAAVIASVQREVEMAGATRRADFLRRLVAGDVSASQLADSAPEFGLDPTEIYLVTFAAPGDSSVLSALASRLRTHCSIAELPVVDAVLDDTLVSLIPRRQPTMPLPSGLVLGCGPATPLIEVGGSFEQARGAHRVAVKHGVTGLVTLADLGSTNLLDASPDARTALDARHLGPVRKQGASGDEILATVAAYLANHRRVDETAAALHLHRNTVRYRLGRFAELSGLRLEDTDDFVLAWWLVRGTSSTRQA